MSSAVSPLPHVMEEDHDDLVAAKFAEFRKELAKFKLELTPQQQTIFENSGHRQVKYKILSIQRHQERSKTMMNMFRLGLFVRKLVHMDTICQGASVAGNAPELSTFTWGPILETLRISQEDKDGVLDSVLDAYQQLGNKIPDLQPHKEMVEKQHDVRECLEYIFIDLIRFHRRVLKLMAGQHWKKTFRARWDDYSNNELKFVLSSIETCGKKLRSLQQIWEQQRAQEDRALLMESNQRLNDHIVQFEDHRIEVNRRLDHQDDQFQDQRIEVHRHIDQYQKDRNPILRAAQVTEQILTQLNDHVMQSQDHQQEMRTLLDDLKRDREQSRERFSNDSISRRENNEQEILAWLSVPNYLDTMTAHDSQKEKWRGDKVTGRWIVKEKQVSEWIHDELPPNPILWMHGKKGAGKTVLASIIIEECKKKKSYKTNFFYCTEDETGQNVGALVAFKAILAQMVVQNEELLPFCRTKQARGTERLNDDRTAKSLLEHYCESELKQFIVVDGLDELKLHERKTIVKELGELVRKNEQIHPGKIRLLLISQDLHDIQSMMRTEHMAPFADTVELDPEKTTDDIRRYVRKQGNEMRAEYSRSGGKDLLDDDLLKKMEELVCARAKGMFLFASLTVENLRQQPNFGDFKEELRDNNFPKELEEVYQKIITRLKSQGENFPNRWRAAKRIFTWLAGAKRPLKWYEIQAALSLNIGRDQRVAFKYDDNHMVKDIREICGALVHVLPGNCIKFIHSTTRDYILKTEELDERQIECDLTTICLQYLSLPCFRPGIPEERRKEYILDGYYIFQDYAMSELKHHLKKFIESTASLFDDPALERQMTDTLSKFTSTFQKSLKSETKGQANANHGSNDDLLAAQVAGPSQQLPQLPLEDSESSSSSPSSPSSQPTLTPLSSQSSQPQSSHIQGSAAAPPTSMLGFMLPSPPPDPAAICKAFQDRKFYPDLVKVWTHICKHEKLDFKSRNKVVLKEMEDRLKETRKIIQGLAEEFGPEQAKGNQLRKMYGTRVYKCYRANCDYFHEGFDTEKSQGNHSNRHDRPYHCPIADCRIVPSGFATNKDCEKHVRDIHPGEGDLAPRFAVLSVRKRAESRHACVYCGKKFTRKSNKVAHEESHLGIRKFQCRTCDKAFTRQSDRKRHEDTVHTRRGRRIR